MTCAGSQRPPPPKKKEKEKVDFKMEFNLQISNSSRCFLLVEEILNFSRSAMSHGVGYEALPSPCLLNLGTDAAKLRRALWHMQLKRFLTLSSAILSACISSLLLPSESRRCRPNLCPTSLSILCNYCC